MLVEDRFEIEKGILTAYTGSDADVRIPEGVEAIGDGVFKGMAWLHTVTLPSTLKKIGSYAFKGCRRIKNIDFPDGLLEVGEYAFHRCHDLERMIFPGTMTKVGSHAFLYCDSLDKVVMEGPLRLEKATFSHNIALREISLNKDLDGSNFGDEVFEGCICLKRIVLSGKTYQIGNLIETMNSHSDFPDLIKSIAKSVFHSMQIEDGILHTFNINLKSVSLPEGITVIGKGSFFDKRGIISIVLPRSLREIRANAFLNCTGLEEVTLQNPDVIMDEKAFRGCCNLKKVILSGETYYMEDETDIETVGRIRDQILGDFYISGRILVRYMGDEEQVRIPKEVEIIGERCFFGNERVKTVLCPEGLTEIREQAFSGCVTLQNIVLPDRIKRVEREAFAECKKLLKCNLPESIEYIGEYAFRRCITLKPFETLFKNAYVDPYAFYKARYFEDIYKEPGLTQIGKSIDNAEDAGEENCTGQFKGKDTTDDCSKLSTRMSGAEKSPYPYGHMNEAGECIGAYAHTNSEDIRVLTLNGVKRIGKYAFASSKNLEEIIIESPECVIEEGAFSGCPNLNKVRLYVKQLGKGIFSYCRKLAEVVLQGVSVLPAAGFAGCSLLQKFEAKELEQMEARCFDECIRLNSFDFSGIKVIGERAFERCDSLKCVELDRVECGYHAFADCASLERAAITENTVLKSGAFIGCTQIKTIVYDSQEYGFCRFADSLNHAGNPYPIPVREVISSIYSCFEICDGKVLTGYNCDASGITIPQDIEEIGQDLFRDHIRLKDIDIPKSVKIFGSHAFSQTGWLDEQRKKSEMIIINRVLVDGANCKEKAVIPDSVQRIASWCFAGNIDITELVIPSERIAVEALAFRNCINLKKITDWNNTVYELKSVSDVLKGNYPETIQKIFAECINCFKLDENGNLTESTGNIQRLTFPEGIKSIGDGVYKDCHLLESIALSADTASIGRSAFESSKWLKRVINAKAVSSIGAMAFSGCQSLESVDLSDNLTEMGNRCFEHCSSLKEIAISAHLEKIPERAFFRCKSLKNLVIPESVKTIEAEAFAFCDGLEKVAVPDKTRIAETAFAHCGKVQISRYN